MSQIFRRSNLPTWLGGNAGPAQAPHDPEVRKWLDGGMSRKEALPAARQLEKALARKPEVLDLSSTPPHLLRQLPVDLLRRLSAATQTLVLPPDCPVDVAMRLMHEMDVRRLEPKSVMAAVEHALSPRPMSPVPLRPRTPPTAPMPAKGSTGEPVYDVPPRRAGGDYDIPPYRAGGDYDIPTRRGIKGYERPESLFVSSDAGSPQRRDDRGPAADTDCFEGADYVEGSDDVEDPDYVLIEVRRAPVDPADPIYVNRAAVNQAKAIQAMNLEVIRRQGVLLDQVTLPPLPSRLGVTLQDIQEAEMAMRAPRAWHQTHAVDEGRYPRCAMPSRDALVLARALLGLPMEFLSARERASMVEARKALASHRPYTMLQLDPDAVGHLGDALDAVKRLVLHTEHAPPKLPGRQPSSARLLSAPRTTEG